MRRFLASLTLLGWLLVLLTGAATVGFLVALNTWYGGSNAVGWPWHIPNRPVWTRTDYGLLPLFAILFFWGSSWLLSRLGVEVFRGDGSEESGDGETEKDDNKGSKWKRRGRSRRG